MFVQEVKQYKEIFQGIKWRLIFTREAARNGIEVQKEASEVIEGQNIYQACKNETGLIVTDRFSVYIIRNLTRLHHD